MSDSTSMPLWGINKLSQLSKRGDIIFALGIMAVLTVLVLPMPRWLLDMSLALSLMVSILVLVTALFIERPLEFNSFPTLLLVSTMLRLSLNVASTRLILGHGHEGANAAGQVIKAFGAFIMQGNFVIGLIVFAILVLVNFVVITKGSGRIAEVSARFTLDSMPGKQMAVDADLSAGIINEEEAKLRRKTLETESNFYGAMDGAAKFVRGDAIAGLCITFINIIGGIIIGVAQMGVSFSDAAQSYTMLTVGDGLVSQIPALIVSTAAGILVSKTSVDGSSDKALFAQLSAYPAALGLSSFLMACLALLPGIPFAPFIILALVTGVGAWKISEKQDIINQQQAEKKETAVQPDDVSDPVKEALHMDQVRLEVGYGLLPLLNGTQGQKFTEQVKALRSQIAKDLGFVLPTVRIQDNLELNQFQYVIKIKELEVTSGEIKPDLLMCMNPSGPTLDIHGELTQEPTFGLQAIWITHTQKREAEDKGYTVVEPLTVLVTHISETIKDNTSDLFNFVETQKMIDGLDKIHQKLIKDICPAQITMGNIQRVLQNLLKERVSIRDLPTILEGIAEVCNTVKNVTQITEHVRVRLSRQISSSNSDSNAILPIVTLSPDWDSELQNALAASGESSYLALPPTKLQEFTQLIQKVFDEQAGKGKSPVLLVNATLRPHIYSIIERLRSSIVVLSHNEVHPKAKIQTLATV